MKHGNRVQTFDGMPQTMSEFERLPTENSELD
jgi:hypothetical protein